jgi:Cytochrome c3
MSTPRRRTRTHLGIGATLRALVVSAGLGLLALVAFQGVIAGATPDPGATIATPSPSTSQSTVPSLGSSPTLEAPATEAPATAAPAPVGSLTPDTNTCYTCHTAIDSTQHDIADQWKASVHGQNGVACADCHGGDPTSDQVTIAMSPAKGFRGVPTRTDTVALCGNCHSDVDRMRQFQIPTDEYSKYKASVHGERLLNSGDTRVAICTDCHGTHDVKKASDPTAKVYPLNVPALCASCHSDANLMAPYGIPTNQYDIYKQSVHGQALLVNSDLRAPTCASCHGSHDAKPPTSADVVQVCGKCHTATEALYEQSLHSTLTVGPKCWTCHGTHDVALPDESRFLHTTAIEINCATCHNPVDKSLKLNVNQFVNDADRRCDTCHHTDSIDYAQAKSIHDELAKASTAYADAQAKIKEAADVGMIVSDADVQLTEANTNLIQARAAVHTTKLTVVAPLAETAVTKANEARDFAESRLAESVFRREAMVVVLVLILVNVFALILIRRRLDHSFNKP